MIILICILAYIIGIVAAGVFSWKIYYELDYTVLLLSWLSLVIIGFTRLVDYIEQKLIDNYHKTNK